METTPLRLTRESIRLIHCRVKDDSSGGGPCYECCYGPTLEDAVACARRNLHHNYVDIYLEIQVGEVDQEEHCRRLSTRFAHPLTLDRALSQELKEEKLILLTESVSYYDCVAHDEFDTSVSESLSWKEACEWFREHQNRAFVEVMAIIEMRRDEYNQQGTVASQSTVMRAVSLDMKSLIPREVDPGMAVEKSPSTEQYLSDMVEKMIGVDLNARVDRDSEHLYEKYLGALACTFDLNSKIVAQVANYDYVRLPHIPKDRPAPNYTQLLTLDQEAENAISELLSFLVDHAEADYREPYEHSIHDKERIRMAISGIAKTHGTALVYARWVSKRLWRAENYLEETYGHYVALLQKRIESFNQGRGFVFDHMVENRAVFIR
jgi:hypothetical protein